MRVIVDPSIFRTKVRRRCAYERRSRAMRRRIALLGIRCAAGARGRASAGVSDPVLPFAPAPPVWSGPFPGFSEGPLPTDEEVFPDFPVSAAF